MPWARSAAVTAVLIVLIWWCVRTFAIYTPVVVSFVVALVILGMIVISVIRSVRQGRDGSNGA
jgi:hypothetical protein